MANNQTDKRREMLKALLQGKASASEFLEVVGGPQLDASLLTQAEQKVLEGLSARYNAAYASSTKSDQWGERTSDGLSVFSGYELGLFGVLRAKATPEEPKRYLLERVDLTTVTHQEIVAAFKIITLEISKKYGYPEWLQD